MRTAIYKSRFRTFKFLADLEILNSELISILNSFYKKILRNPNLYWEETDELEKVLSEKFNPDFSQRVLSSINVQLSQICVDISEKYFLEKMVQWARLNKLIFYIVFIGISFLIRPFWAFAGQDSPRESTKKVVQIALAPYAISTPSHQIDVAHNLAPIDAKKAEMKESERHSSPQNSPKKNSVLISSDLNKENIEEKLGSVLVGSDLSVSSSSASASRKTTQGQQQKFPPSQKISSNSSKIPSPAVSVRLKGVIPSVKTLRIKVKPDWRAIKPLVNGASSGDFLYDALKTCLEMDPSIKDLENNIRAQRYIQAVRATALAKESPEYKQQCFEHSLHVALTRIENQSLTKKSLCSKTIPVKIG